MVWTLITLSFLALLCLAALPLTPTGGTPDKGHTDLEAVTDWLRHDAMRLQSLRPGAAYSDLMPLKAVLDGVRVVGLGEATHGSREFSLLKHRLVEFLVREMGFTVFAIEASYPACLSINDYVLHGTGDRAQALAGLGFWTCDTEEVSDLIDWMRAYNQSAPEDGRVQFLGIDLQSLAPGQHRLVDYLQRVAPDQATSADHLLDDLLDDEQRPQRTADERDRIREGLYRLLEFLTLHQARLQGQSSASEFGQAVQQMRVMIQFEEVSSRPVRDAGDPASSGSALRDRYMAQNVEDILTAHGGKAMVWAHNSHVALAVWGGGVPSLGHHLHQRFGGAYYALGLVFNEGAFQARNADAGDPEYMAVREFCMGPAPHGSLEWYCAQARIGDFLADFRSAPKEGVVAQWLRACIKS